VADDAVPAAARKYLGVPYLYGVRGLMTEPRQVTAIIRFRAGPGREQEAAEAWAFELTYYFTRGVGEPPAVSYENGVYTVTGIMQTTHPGDREITDFTPGEPWDLGWGQSPARRAMLRELYGRRGIRFDGRAGGHPVPLEPGARHGTDRVTG
jgi:hypothetical protein